MNPDNSTIGDAGTFVQSNPERKYFSTQPPRSTDLTALGYRDLADLHRISMITQHWDFKGRRL
jgi:hypothetical protein